MTSAKFKHAISQISLNLRENMKGDAGDYARGYRQALIDYRLEINRFIADARTIALAEAEA